MKIIGLPTPLNDVPQGETFYFAGTMPQTLIFRGPEIFSRNFKIPIDNWDFMLYPFCS